MYNDRDITHPDDAPETEHGEHGHGGFSRTPQDAGNAVGEGEQEIEERDCSRVGRSVCDHLRRAVECGDQGRYGYVDHDAHKLRSDDGTEDAEARPLFGALILSRTEILTDKGGQRHGETGDGQEAEALDLGVCAAAGHSHLAEFVDVGLYDHIGEGDDGILKPGGQTVGDHFPEYGKIKTDAP